MRRRLEHALLAPVTIAVLATTAACGGSPSVSVSDGVGDDARHRAALEYAKCMRENGVPDFPDPNERGMFEITPETDVDQNSPALRQAQEACQSLLGRLRPPDLSEEERQEMMDKALEFARCMREHGVEVPDPSPSRGGGLSLELPPNFDPDDPTFRAAQEACEGILPGEGGALGSAP